MNSLSKEDTTNLKIIQQSRKFKTENDLIKNIKNDTILSTTRTVAEMTLEEMAVEGTDGQIIPPPTTNLKNINQK